MNGIELEELRKRLVTLEKVILKELKSYPDEEDVKWMAFDKRQDCLLINFLFSLFGFENE